ncbi:MAG: hypothetical protein EOM68_20995, partial [Spirochaetia bacterium]|nr:hypothetical protein [Spirochaetia bacterium]
MFQSPKQCSTILHDTHSGTSQYAKLRTIFNKSLQCYYLEAAIRKVYVPMTETGFYILLCLQQEMHGY